MLRKLVVMMMALLVCVGPLALVRQYAVRVTSAGPLAGLTITLDPGHGGVDPGALGPQGVHEKDIVLAIALLLRDAGVKRGDGCSDARDRHGPK